MAMSFSVELTSAQKGQRTRAANKARKQALEDGLTEDEAEQAAQQAAADYEASLNERE